MFIQYAREVALHPLSCYNKQVGTPLYCLPPLPQQETKMAISNNSLKQLANKLSTQYINDLYESEAFTELAMETADKFLADIEMDEETKMDLSFLLLESIQLTSWKHS